MSPLPSAKIHKPRNRLAVLKGMSGQISSTITSLTLKSVGELTRSVGKKGGRSFKFTIPEYKEMLESEPLSRACCELKALRAVASFGEYSHSDKETQEWMRANFETMKGSLSTTVKDLSSSLPYGFACAELVFTSKMAGHKGQWRLERINPLDPERVSFYGKVGDITHVIYKEKSGERRYIPYRKVLHVVNGACFGSPFGSPEAERAMPFCRAKNLLFSEMMVAGKNNASGIWLGKADSNETVILTNPDGSPQRATDGSPKTVSAVEALNQQLQNLESSGVITTDLKNQLQPMLIPSDANFWNNGIMLLKKEILLSYLTPSMIWDEGSFSHLGNTGLSGNHKAILDANIAAIVKQIQEEILEKLVRWLLIYNRPKSIWKKDFGSFQAQAHNDPNFLISQAGNLLQAINSQVLPSSDLDVMNTLREALGIPPIDEQQQYKLLQKQIEQQLYQQQAFSGASDASGSGQPQPQSQNSGFSYW